MGSEQPTENHGSNSPYSVQPELSPCKLAKLDNKERNVKHTGPDGISQRQRATLGHSCSLVAFMFYQMSLTRFLSTFLICLYTTVQSVAKSSPKMLPASNPNGSNFSINLFPALAAPAWVADVAAERPVDEDADCFLLNMLNKLPRFCCWRSRLYGFLENGSFDGNAGVWTSLLKNISVL